MLRLFLDVLLNRRAVSSTYIVTYIRVEQGLLRNSCVEYKESAPKLNFGGEFKARYTLLTRTH